MPRSKKVIKEVVTQIDEMFRKSKQSRLPASLFHNSIRSSKLTLGRARRLLKVKTQRMRSSGSERFITYWFRGTHALAETIEEIEKEERQQIEDFAASRRTSALTEAQEFLQNFMTADGTNYEIKGTEVIKALYELYSPRTVVKAKHDLGIKSVKRKDGWYWLWPAQEIQDWLENLLLEEPVLRDDIYKQAAAKGWSREAVDLARARLGHGSIIQYFSEKNGGWLWKQA